MGKKLLVIIPAYNEEENIEKTVTAILNHKGQFDYIVINDCSTDRTGEICRERGYHHINLPINLGIGGAVQMGYQYALRNGYERALSLIHI